MLRFGEKAEQEAAYRAVMERRRNPKKMAQYEAEVSSRRKKLAQDRANWSFQNKRKTPQRRA